MYQSHHNNLLFKVIIIIIKVKFFVFVKKIKDKMLIVR